MKFHTSQVADNRLFNIRVAKVETRFVWQETGSTYSLGDEIDVDFGDLLRLRPFSCLSSSPAGHSFAVLRESFERPGPGG